MEAGKKPTLKDIERLPKLERIVMNYFMKHISVGEIIAIVELRELIKSMNDPGLDIERDDIIIERAITKALASLVEKGFLEHAEGCYNLPEHLRKEIMRKRSQIRKLF